MAQTLRAERPASLLHRVGGSWWLVLGVVAAVHLVAAARAAGPVWLEDEVGYLSNAQALSGAGSPPSLDAAAYYVGWSVPLVPLWWILPSPGAVYAGAVALAAVAGVLLVLPLAALAARLGAPPGVARWAAAAVAVAPARTVPSGFVVAENFLTLLVALLAVLVLRWTARGRPVDAALAGALAGATVATHGRMAPVVLVVALLALDRLRSGHRDGWVALGAVLVVTRVAVWVNASLDDRVYAAGPDREAMGRRAFELLEPLPVVQSAIGQVWYGVAAWAGLTVVGAALLLRTALVEIRRRELGAAAGLVLAGLGVGAVSVTWVASVIGAEGAGRVDYFAYGRYLDPLWTLLALVGLVRLLLRARERARSGVLVMLVVAVTTGLALVISRADAARGVGAGMVNVAGLTAWDWTGSEGLTVPWVRGAVPALLLGVGAVAWGTRGGVGRLALPLLVAGLVAASVAAQLGTSRGVMAPDDSRILLLRDEIAALDPGTVALDLEGISRESRNGYQFWLAHRDIALIRRTDGLPAADVVVSRVQWPAAQAAGWARVAADRTVDDALWVAPPR